MTRRLMIIPVVVMAFAVGVACGFYLPRPVETMSLLGCQTTMPGLPPQCTWEIRR